MKKFSETIGQAFARARTEGARKPLRTITELADEFGVTRQDLALRMRRDGGPEPVMQHTSRYSKATWYSPDGVREWWRLTQLQDEGVNASVKKSI